MDADPINLLNLTPELQTVVATMLTIQHCGNRPADLGDLMAGLYGKMSDYDLNGQEECVQEFARVVNRLYTLGWITRPDAEGRIMLTDTGDENATILRQYYEAAGVIDFSRI